MGFQNPGCIALKSTTFNTTSRAAINAPTYKIVKIFLYIVAGFLDKSPPKRFQPTYIDSMKLRITLKDFIGKRNKGRESKQ